MKLHGFHQACAIALLAVAPIVAAQTSGTASGPTATTPGGDNAAAAPAPSGKQSAMSPDMSRTHATKPHKHSMQVSGGSTQTMSHSDSAYHGALKRCVEGPADQRDGCIDQAIKQYGPT